MGWISDRLLKKRRTYDEEFASTLYDALVLGGGPSADAESHIDSHTLNIPLDKLERFAAKRLITLEAFLFVAVNVATMPAETNDTATFQPVHPLSIQLSRLLQAKWRQRGIEIKNHLEVGERCFEAVELALEKPFRWGRGWLEEFYDDPEKSGEHYILWTEQCLKEFEAMRMVVAQNV